MRQYYFVFNEENNTNWTRDMIANQLFLKGCLNHAENVRAVKGYVFLNDVLDMLGFGRISRGQLDGWFDQSVTFDFAVGHDFAVIGFEAQKNIYKHLRKS